jgi:hypothetical protein
MPPLTADDPRTVAPLLNVTVPWGAVDPLAVTVAVSVTDWPSTDGFGEEANVTEVPVELIVSANGAEVLLPVKAVLPA